VQYYASMCALPLPPRGLDAAAIDNILCQNVEMNGRASVGDGLFGVCIDHQLLQTP